MPWCQKIIGRDLGDSEANVVIQVAGTIERKAWLKVVLYSNRRWIL